MEERIPYWRLSGFYFFYFGSLGIFLPYWSLFLQGRGFTPQQIGVLTALLVGTKIVAPNVLAWLSDRLEQPVRIIRIASQLAMLLFAGIFAAHGYSGVALVTLLFSLFWNAVLPQIEAVTLSHLKGALNQYSHIRLWGSVGFILTVVGVGALVKSSGVELLPVWISCLLLAIWLNSLCIPETVEQASRDSLSEQLPVRRKPGRWQWRGEVVALLAALMLVQVAHAPYYVFFSIHLEQQAYSETAIGWIWSLGVVAEILLFSVMHHILHRFSPRAILVTSIALAIVRWLAIGWAADSVFVLVLAQLLHAATFGSSHVAAIHFIHLFFRDGRQSHGQALYSSISFGLGGMLGSLYSGVVWEKFGALVLYSSAAFFSFVAALVVWVWVGRSEAPDRILPGSAGR